jgi:hypothetical protein
MLKRTTASDARKRRQIWLIVPSSEKCKEDDNSGSMRIHATVVLGLLTE